MPHTCYIVVIIIIKHFVYKKNSSVTTRNFKDINNFHERLTICFKLVNNSLEFHSVFAKKKNVLWL